MSLKKYNKKRNFKNTTEPKGEIKTAKNKKLKFVIQHHLARREHYDLRLEHNGVLISFAVPKGLPKTKGQKNLAVHVEDHPLDYINFKGIIPKGNYGAGVVEIYDKGEYIPLIPLQKSLKNGNIKFEIKGKIVKGEFALIKTKEPNWLILNIGEEKPLKNPFNKVSVKLASLTTTIPKKDYLFEIKYDGYRIVAFCGKDVRLASRNNLDYSTKFKSITKSLKSINKILILDGEVVVFDKTGRSDFSLLQSSITLKKQNFVYVIFDILALNGKDLRNTPLKERKKILEENLNNLPPNLILSSYLINNGKQSFSFAKKHNLEGIVAKKIDSNYNSLRDDDWLKIKCYHRQEFVIGGFTQTLKNKNLSALLVGYYKNKDFIYVGKVGTGFNETLRKELYNKFSKIIRKTSPFKNLVSNYATFIQPKYICEIQYAELTSSNSLRQPSFIGLRTDKLPTQVVLEEKPKE